MDTFGDCYIFEDMTVSEFLDTLKNHPASLWQSYDVRLAICTLRHHAYRGKEQDAEDARKILALAGLSCMVPKYQFRDALREFWNENPTKALYYLKQTEQIFRDAFAAAAPSADPEDVIKGVVGDMFEALSPPEIAEWYGQIRARSDSLTDPKKLALAIFSITWNLSYTTLYGRYYKEWGKMEFDFDPAIGSPYSRQYEAYVSGHHPPGMFATPEGDEEGWLQFASSYTPIDEFPFLPNALRLKKFLGK